ncbi:MAG: D-alanine--D-alanine ligase family protein [Chloroflexota bacterium]
MGSETLRVAVVYNALAPGETDPSTLDVLVQVRHVSALLIEAGHIPAAFGCGRDVHAVAEAIRGFGPDRIFNLVESVEGHAALHPCAAAVWDLLGIPYTGASSRALALTTDKHLAKLLLRANGIQTPVWAVCEAGDRAWQTVPGPWILKPAHEDGSIGIDEESVVREAHLMEVKLAAMHRQFDGQPIMVEQFIEGREFNVAMLGPRRRPLLLPPAELRFRDYPAGKERVAGFRAKWDPTSFEYQHLERSFDFGPEDAGLLERLHDIELRCWRIFGLSGYARVDIRVDGQSEVWVLEVNANPCLSPDGGFAAAVACADISPVQMVDAILREAVCVPRHPTVSAARRQTAGPSPGFASVMATAAMAAMEEGSNASRVGMGHELEVPDAAWASSYPRS